MASPRTRKAKFTKAELGQLGAAFTVAVQEYEDVLATRAPEFSSVMVVSLPADAAFAGIPEGCAVAYFAKDGNKQLAQLAAALEAKDSKSADKLVSRIERSLIAAMDVSDQPGRAISSLPVLGELRYRTKTISRAVFIGKVAPIEVRFFPYNGGKLYSSDFKLVQFKNSPRSKSLQALLVTRQPRLSKLERDILAQVSRAGTEANIGQELAFMGKITKAVTKVLGKITKKITEAFKVTVEKTKTVTNLTTLTTELITVMPGECPLLPMPLRAAGAKKGASAAELLAVRRRALLDERAKNLNLS